MSIDTYVILSLPLPFGIGSQLETAIPAQSSTLLMLWLAVIAIGVYFLLRRTNLSNPTLPSPTTAHHPQALAAADGRHTPEALSGGCDALAESAYRQLVTLNRIVQELNATLNVQEVFAVVARYLAELVPHDRASIALFDETRRHFTIFSLVEAQESQLREGVSLPVDATAAARDLLAGRPHLTPDLTAELEYPAERLLFESGCRSRVNVPLMVHHEVIGALNLASTRLNAFQAADLPLLEQIAADIAAALEKARLFEETQRRSEEIAKLLRQLQESYDQTLAALCTALDIRDRETEGHSRRVAELACAIAREMGLSEDELTHLFRGGLLHDVGKIGIPDAVLHKREPLTEEEWQLMRQHPLLGARILQDIDFLAQAVDVVLFHQERYDGEGYPYGLRGSEIPLLARIFAVADAYDAMTSHRPYREAMSHEEAVAEIVRHSGTQFDPEVVQAFLRVAQRLRGDQAPLVPTGFPRMLPG